MKNEFFSPNPFQKGYISDEDRKKQLRFYSDDLHYEFYSNTIDLYDGVQVTFIKDTYHKYPDIQSYSHALAEFMMWWEREIRQHLNGFCGFDCIKFKFLGFGCVKLD